MFVKQDLVFPQSYFIRSYRDETIGRGAQVIESHWAYDVVVVAREAGYLLNNLMAEGS